MLSLHPERLKRYKSILRLIFRYARPSLLGRLEADAVYAAPIHESDNDKPEQFARDLEELGPTFIKLGQLLSTRPDFLPVPYIEALSRLQDDVKPFPYEDVERILEEELKLSVSKAFFEFDREPLAAASLGQVHRASLRDGRMVAVKIQRPGIRQTVANDLDALEQITRSLESHTEVGHRYAFGMILAEFKRALSQELDYLQEAHNLEKLHGNLSKYENIIIPLPISSYTTSKVLTMEYVRGKKITKLGPLACIELDGKALAESLFKAYLDQILVDGFFHADPHPGNVFITDDHKIALIDLGIVARIDPEISEKLLKLLLYVSDGRGTEAANQSLELSVARDGFDKTSFITQVKDFVLRYQDSKLENIDVGRVVVELTRIAANNGLRTLSELTLLGKTLLNLDQIGKLLHPEFDPNAVIREHAVAVLRRHLFRNVTTGSVYTSLLESKEFMQKLPLRLNNILEALSSKEFEVKLDVFDELRVVESFQKVANRIALGLVLAALIIGAALMMRVETAFKILGYPAFAMLMFMAAAAFGFMLIINIFLHDEWRSKMRARRKRRY